jgi:hypothetical protein
MGIDRAGTVLLLLALVLLQLVIQPELPLLVVLFNNCMKPCQAHNNQF